jgi:transposase
MAISNDVRRRVISARESGKGTLQELSKLFDVGTASIKRWMRLKRETGATDRPPSGAGRPRSIEHEMWLCDYLSGHNDATLSEVCDAYGKYSDKTVSASTMCRTLTRMGWRRKKNGLRDRTRQPTSGTKTRRLYQSRALPVAGAKATIS